LTPRSRKDKKLFQDKAQKRADEGDVKTQRQKRYESDARTWLKRYSPKRGEALRKPKKRGRQKESFPKSPAIERKTRERAF